jgi:hypothetical protein
MWMCDLDIRKEYGICGCCGCRNTKALTDWSWNRAAKDAVVLLYTFCMFHIEKTESVVHCKQHWIASERINEQVQYIQTIASHSQAKMIFNVCARGLSAKYIYKHYAKVLKYAIIYAIFVSASLLRFWKCYKVRSRINWLANGGIVMWRIQRVHVVEPALSQPHHGHQKKTETDTAGNIEQPHTQTLRHTVRWVAEGRVLTTTVADGWQL